MNMLREQERSKWNKVAMTVIFLLATISDASLIIAAQPSEGEKVYTAADIKITDAQRRAAEAFYRDKTIEWVSYTNPGSGTELMLRIMMKYLPKYIPGNPRMGSVQFMRGGGGLLSVNYIYSRAAKDGTVIGQLFAIERNQAVARKGVNYDLNKFTYIANYLPQNHRILYTRKGIGVDTIEQLMKAPRVNMGVMEVGHNFYVEMRLGIYLLGVNFNIIPGYSDPELDLALERGELDGKVDAAVTFLTQRRRLLEQGKIVIHWQSEPTRFRGLPNIPTLLELAKRYANPPLGPQDAALQQTNWDLGRYARYLVMPPGVPVERALAVQEAVGKMIEDKEFYAEFSKQTGFEPEFTPGDVLLQDFRRLVGQPKEVLDLWLKLSGPGPLPKR